MAKKKTSPKKITKSKGRPSKYTEKIADKICHQIATTSNGLCFICKGDDMPSTVTVYAWLNDEKHKDFLNKYVRAREQQADLLADEIISIADDGQQDDEIRYNSKGESYVVENKEWTNRSRLRVDARKWKASKLAPKKYGDKQAVELTVTEQPLFPDESK